MGIKYEYHFLLVLVHNLWYLYIMRNVILILTTHVMNSVNEDGAWRVGILTEIPEQGLGEKYWRDELWASLMQNWLILLQWCSGFLLALVVIGLDNGLAPDRCQAIIWTNADLQCESDIRELTLVEFQLISRNWLKIICLQLVSKVVLRNWLKIIWAIGVWSCAKDERVNWICHWSFVDKFVYHEQEAGKMGEGAEKSNVCGMDMELLHMDNCVM